MFSNKDIRRDALQLFGAQARKGYDWWWHSFTARSERTGEEKAFYIEYFLCNPYYGKKEPVFGQKKENRENGVRPSYLMVNAGTWGKDKAQLHRFFGWKETDVSYGIPYSVTASDCSATETHIRGSIHVKKEEAENEPWLMSDSGTMEWDLIVDKKIPFNVGYGASGPMRRLQLFQMFWHAEGMKTEYEGTVTYNGERYIVTRDTCYGYADKNWGKDFTTPWLWLSSCNLTSSLTGEKLESSVFDIGGGRPKIGPVALKGKLLSAFFVEGREYEFNFSKFWTFTRTRFTAKETEEEIVWNVEQKTLRHRMTCTVRCRKDDMLLIRYESPDGRSRHTRLWNGGNGKGSVSIWRGKKLVEMFTAENIGCEYGEYDADEKSYL